MLFIISNICLNYLLIINTFTKQHQVEHQVKCQVFYCYTHNTYPMFPNPYMQEKSCYLVGIYLKVLATPPPPKKEKEIIII